MLMTVRPPRGRRGLQEYQNGYYPVPGWSYTAQPCCGVRRRRRGMGDLFADPNPAIFVSSGPEIPPAPSGVYPVGPGGSLTSIQLAQLAIGSNEGLIPMPAVSPSTLLAAAALPNAPASVVQAASAYRSANPVSAFLSGSVAGIPTMYLLGGGAAVLLLAGFMKRR